jgi:hypothetical protein
MARSPTCGHCACRQRRSNLLEDLRGFGHDSGTSANSDSVAIAGQARGEWGQAM